jgi:hypothetical protein
MSYWELPSFFNIFFSLPFVFNNSLGAIELSSLETPRRRRWDGESARQEASQIIADIAYQKSENLSRDTMTGPGSRPNVLPGAATGESIKQKLSGCRPTLKQISPDGMLARNREVPENIVQLICGRYTSSPHASFSNVHSYCV